MASAQSPTSSPRLPSPPPMAEDQIGPTSPGVSLFEEGAKFPGMSSIDTGASRRIRPGTRAEDMTEGPPLVELQEIDSAFQLTEHLKSLHHALTHPSTSDTVQPITPEIARQLTTPPPNTSRDIWLYELGRFLIQKTNAIIIALFSDDPPCSAQTCAEMRASEWQYLCAVHDPPKSCAAIDYCCHTLDWACNTLASPKNFPSRLGLGSGGAVGGGAGDKLLQNQLKEIKNIFRRVYRIYAHAWFSHREMFWRVEAKTGLYVFFKMVCDEYNIIDNENYTIPAEAEGLEPETPLARAPVQEARSVLKREPDDASAQGLQSEPVGSTVMAIGDTTKRHRHTPSDLTSSASNVIQEEAEEEEEQGREGSSSPPKPGLGRQATALKEWPEGLDMSAPGEEEAEEEPVPGMLRSETMKPVKVEEEGEESEQTVVEDVAAEEDAKAEEEEGSEEVKEEVVEVKDEPAAEPEDAGKTVGD